MVQMVNSAPRKSAKGRLGAHPLPPSWVFETRETRRPKAACLRTGFPIHGLFGHSWVHGVPTTIPNVQRVLQLRIINQDFEHRT